MSLKPQKLACLSAIHLCKQPEPPSDKFIQSIIKKHPIAVYIQYMNHFDKFDENYAYAVEHFMNFFLNFGKFQPNRTLVVDEEVFQSFWTLSDNEWSTIQMLYKGIVETSTAVIYNPLALGIFQQIVSKFIFHNYSYITEEFLDNNYQILVKFGTTFNDVQFYLLE